MIAHLLMATFRVPSTQETASRSSSRAAFGLQLLSRSGGVMSREKNCSLSGWNEPREDPNRALPEAGARMSTEFSPRSYSTAPINGKGRWSDLVISFPAAFLIGKLGVQEFRRRLYHMSPAVMALALPWVSPENKPFILLLAVTLVSFVCIAIGLIFQRHFTRDDETQWMSAIFGYLIPVVSPLFLFPQHPEIGLVTLQVLGFGDGCATCGGLLLGGKRLPWNPRKTFAGLCCFTACGMLAAAYAYWGEQHEQPISHILLTCGITALLAGTVESLPIRSNDNFRVGMTALLSMIGLTFFFW